MAPICIGNLTALKMVLESNRASINNLQTVMARVIVAVGFNHQIVVIFQLVIDNIAKRNAMIQKFLDTVDGI